MGRAPTYRRGGSAGFAARDLLLSVAGAAVLAILWLGPLPELAGRAFTAHMTMHMGVVGIAAPLLVLGVAGGRLDPARRWPSLFAPVPAAALELVVVWGWHAPALHHAARAEPGTFALEQASFLGVGLLVWLSAFGGGSAERTARSGAGALGLLLTSMHMTLLGALLGLSPRPLYEHPGPIPWGLSALEDQHLGGAVMLGVGAAVYMSGGLVLVARLLRGSGGGLRDRLFGGTGGPARGERAPARVQLRAAEPGPPPSERCGTEPGSAS